MTTPAGHEVTQLLLDLSAGDQKALEKVLPLIYDELRARAARALRREQPGHTLQTTDLVHEAYLRLVDQRRVRWQNRAHFFAVAAQLMRRILVDHARARHAAKRAGDREKLPLDDAVAYAPERAVDLLALDEALTRFAEFDPQGSRVVELRFFGGLTIEEAAEVMKVSTATIKREWTSAKTWLRRELLKG